MAITMMCGHPTDKKDPLGNPWCWRVSCKANPLRYVVAEAGRPEKSKQPVAADFLTSLHRATARLREIGG
jgi:hypothetical protein